MSDEEGVHVPPPDYLYAHAVAAAITYAALACGEALRAEHYQLFVRQGFDLARGGSGELA